MQYSSAVMVRSLRQLVLFGVFAGALACSKKTPEPTPAQPEVKKAQALPPAAAAAVAAVDGQKLDPNDPKHGSRKLMGLDAPVYVDGVQMAVLRFGEMPAMKAIPLEGGGTRYRLVDYLTGIGVSLDAVKSVHLHGNSDRIASVEGTELRKEKDRFVFSFISGDTGTPLQKWDTEQLKNPFVIHEIRRVTVYVKKPVPAIHPQRQCHVSADGDCTDAIPYATGEIAKGTRVYVDGKMVGFVKRRQMGEAVAAADLPDGEHSYSVVKLLAQMGVEPTSIKTTELMAGDEVVARASGADLLASSGSTYFTLPKHNHGKVRIHVPAAFQARSESGAADRDALVSAVLVYKNTTPGERPIVAISEDTDLSVQLAAIDDARGRLGRGEQ
jgi:hypothetical protein